MKNIMTNVQELVVDVTISGAENSFALKIKNALERWRQESLIYPQGGEDPVAEFVKLVGGVV